MNGNDQPLDCSDVDEATDSYCRRIAQLQAENARLRAAIATPEVYAGVVTEVVERERDEAVAENTRLRTIVDKALRLLDGAHDGSVVWPLQELLKSAKGKGDG